PVTEALALSVLGPTPSPTVRDRLMDRLKVAPTSQIVTRRRDTRVALPAWLAAAALLAIAVGLASYVVRLRDRVWSLEGRLQAAVARAEAGDRFIAGARRTAAEAQSTVIVLVAPDLSRVALQGQPKVAPSATARAFWSRSRGLVFTASDLPALPPGRVYQLWIVSAQAAVSAGLLTPDSNGRVYAVFDTSPDVPKPVAFAV